MRLNILGFFFGSFLVSLPLDFEALALSFDFALVLFEDLAAGLFLEALAELPALALDTASVLSDVCAGLLACLLGAFLFLFFLLLFDIPVQCRFLLLLKI
jgi:hypothetical protein